MDHLLNPDALAALVALTALEIVLGIDNLVLLSVLSGKLPEHQRAGARRSGLLIALVARLVLLAGVGVLVRFDTPLVTVLDHGYSVHDLLLLAGGAFLIGKATYEIHEATEEHRVDQAAQRAKASVGAVILQIAVLDMVFSFDSVITAVGMTPHIWVMVTSVLVSIGFMLVFIGAVAGFIEKHPTVKMLALSFMLAIGVMLVADGLGYHMPRGYLYSAMAFSAFVEAMNYLVRRGKQRRA